MNTIVRFICVFTPLLSHTSSSTKDIYYTDMTQLIRPHIVIYGSEGDTGISPQTFLNVLFGSPEDMVNTPTNLKGPTY